jgi:LIVCS family branched-chain amino acid:cation transporter
MRNERKDFVVIGAALFAMFFGAGNLIFPPALGLLAGDRWLPSMIGFLMTGVGLPILGIIAISKVGGDIKDLASKVGSKFATILGVIIILAIGPLLAIPRTGATVYEIGIQPIFNDANPLLVSAVYFSITLFFVIKPSGIIDKIGKILTPILLTVISVIIAKGIMFPIGNTVSTDMGVPFSNGFVSGYQTMDALGSIILGGLVLKSIREKGYLLKKEQMRLTYKAGILAGAGLVFVYAGLLYLGATAGTIYASDISKTALIIGITNSILGSFGKLGMSFAVSAACLTTSIGLTAVVGDYFEKLSKGKVSYRFIVIATVIFSTVMSVVGVEKIVSIAVPLLVLVYPLAIILIIYNLMDKFIPNDYYYKGAVVGAFVISIFDSLSSMGIQIASVIRIIGYLPFASSGFGWIVPSLAMSMVFGLIGGKIRIDSKSFKPVQETL